MNIADLISSIPEFDCADTLQPGLPTDSDDSQGPKSIDGQTSHHKDGNRLSTASTSIQVVEARRGVNHMEAPTIPSIRSLLNGALAYQQPASVDVARCQNSETIRSTSQPLRFQPYDRTIIRNTFDSNHSMAFDAFSLYPVNQYHQFEGADINHITHQARVSMTNTSSSESKIVSQKHSRSLTGIQSGGLMRIAPANWSGTYVVDDGLQSATRQRSPIRVATYTPYDLLKTVLFETYHGFIEDPLDAVYVVQGTLEGVLPAFRGNSDDMACIKVRSGTIIVMPETGLTVRRWRDGLKWSPSRAYGNFLLYRQIESKNSDVSTKEEDQDLSPYSTPYGSTTGLQPTFTSKTLKEGTQLTENGLTKRTITVKGSDGEKYRVVSYYNSRDVMDMIRQMQQHHVNFDIASELIRASDDVRLKEMMKKSGTDAVALVRQSYPLWKPEEFPLGTNTSPRRQSIQPEVDEFQNPKHRQEELTFESVLKVEVPNQQGMNYVMSIKE